MVDRYTPCALRPIEQHWNRRKTNESASADGCVSPIDSVILHQLSKTISLQEARISDLVYSLDIDGVCRSTRLGINTPPSSLSTLKPSHPSSPNDLGQSALDKTSGILKSSISPRPGRLSPTIIQMILSPNTSIFSEASSGVDTSYDSALFRWLGIRESSSGSRETPDSSSPSKESPDLNISDPDASRLSSGSAYSQSSPMTSPSKRISHPLTPPSTVRPPFTEAFSREDAEVGLASAGLVLPTLSLSEEGSVEDTGFLADFTMPMLLRNISLQHYIPSAAVLRQFQRVVDELRGLYVPNDEGNNVPKCQRVLDKPKRQTVMPGGWSPGSLQIPGALFLPSTRHQLDQAAANTILRCGDGDSRATRELYTELAVMLSGQAAAEEGQVEQLRCLADRLEEVAKRKIEIALVVGKRGREEMKAFNGR